MSAKPSLAEIIFGPNVVASDEHVREAVEQLVRSAREQTLGRLREQHRRGNVLTRAAYEQLIEQNLAWLESMPRTLERDHIIMIVKASAGHEYGDKA